MIVFKILCVLVMFIIFTVAFKKASGSLSINKLNMNSLCYYFLLIYCFIGASVIFLGFRSHYLIEKCSEGTIEKTYWYIMYSLIALPIAIFFFSKFVGIRNIGYFFENYSKTQLEDIEDKSESMFTVVFLLTILGFIAIVYTFYCIGYVPLLTMLMGNSEMNRQRVAIAREFSGNVYIRNLFALTLIPTLSYLAYIYYRKLKTWKWFLLFIILLIMSILCKTYAFEKSPIIIYISYFYIIELMINNATSVKKAIPYAIGGIVAILAFYYIFAGYAGKVLTLSSGPLSRLFITQISTGYLHVEAFPAKHYFLKGASFPTAISWIFNSKDSWIRSGRVVMEIFNPSGVQEGTAGVMNSLFMAEAYANFGVVGVILAPWLVGAVISIIPCMILKQRKTPLNIVLYIVFASSYANILVGGFVDYFYDISLVFVLILFVAINLVANRGKILVKK